MKRIITLLLALALSIISVLLMSSDSPVEAQQGQTMKGTFRTGVIALTANENLSLTVAAGDTNGDGRIDGTDAIAVRFRRTQYIKTNCADGVCRYVVESVTVSDPVIVMPNEAVRSELMGNQIGTDRTGTIEALTSSKNAQATVHLYDALTGQTKSVLVALFVP